MEKPIALMSTDWHVTKDNSKEIINIFKEKMVLAVGLGLKEVFVLGDIFVSRISQRMEILDSLWQILNIASDFDIMVYLIPGNHDKTDYKSDRSFLRYYQHHPNLTLIENHHSLIRGGYEIHLMPFFANDCELFKENFNKCCTPNDKSKKQILMSHFAVQGSINNDGTKVDYGSSVSEFKGFDMVFLGHYHNKHNVSKNIMHIPSLRQNNFGEDADKGFTIMFEDGLIELVSPKFTKFIKLYFDLSEISFNDLLKESKKYSKQEGDNIRFIISGDENELKSLDTSIFTSLGIDVKKNMKNYVPILVDVPILSEVFEWNNSQIISKFKSFCEDKGLDIYYGMQLLEEIISKPLDE